MTVSSEDFLEIYGVKSLFLDGAYYWITTAAWAET